MLWLWLLAVVPGYAVGLEPFFRSDYTYVQQYAGGGWLKFHLAPLPWHQARRRCQYEGSKLATPMSQADVGLHSEVMAQHNVSAMYIGAHATFTHGEYFTVDGIPYAVASRVSWRRDGLRYSKTDQCVVVHDDGLASSVDCDEARPFLCFKKFAHLKNVNDCGTMDPAYILNKSTGSCYKLHNEYQDWSTAVEVCSAEGGYLAIPSDKEETEILSHMVPDGQMGAECAFVGIYNWEKALEFEWYTVHGDLVTAHWDRPGGSMRHCAAIRNTGMLQRQFCNDKKPFICEKDPASLTMRRVPPGKVNET